jgi:hypothetical protein
MCWEFVLFWRQVMGTVSTEVILSFKLNTARLIEEMLAVLWNLKVRYCAHKNLNQLNKFYNLVPYFYNIHFNTVFHLCISLSRGLSP